MMRIRDLFVRKQLRQLLFGLQRCLGRSESDAIAHAEDMRIHGKPRRLPQDGRDDIRSFPSNAGQFQQSFKVIRDLAVVLLNKDFGSSDQVARFVGRVGDSFDIMEDLVKFGADQGRGIRKAFKQRRSGLIHPLVRTLCGEHDSHEQLKRRVVVELCHRRRDYPCQSFQHQSCLLFPSHGLDLEVELGNFCRNSLENTILRYHMRDFCRLSFLRLLLGPLFMLVLASPAGAFAQGAWTPAGADLSYPRTLLKSSEIPAARNWILNNPDMFSFYAGLYSDAFGQNLPPVLSSNQDRRIAAHTAKNCAYVLLLDRKPVQPSSLDTLSNTDATNLQNKAISLLERINTNVETYPDFGNYLWRANELIDNLIAYDLLKGAGVPDSLLTISRAKLHEYSTNFHTQVAFNTFGLGLTSLHVDNHTLRACGALGMSAVVLNDATSSSVDGQPQKWIQTALWNIDNVLWRSNVRQSDPGVIAGYSEGPHYLRFGMRHCLQFFHAMGNFVPDNTFAVTFDGRNANVRHPFHDPNFDLLWEWVMRIRMPDGRDPQIEDCFAQTFNADMVLTEDPRFRPTYHGTRFNPTAPTTLWDQLHHSSDDIAADFISAMLPPTTDTFSLLQVLPQSGDVVMRSGWDTTSTYLHIAAKNGRTRSSANGHNHVDVTGFILHARGQELAVDPGYLKWDRRDEIDGPAHHNMVLVNGLGPTEATTGVAGDADGFAAGEFDFQHMDYAEVTTAYQGATIVRKPLFVRGDYFLIADEITTGASNNYQWQLHALGLEGGDSTHGSFAIDSAGSSATWTKNGVNLKAVITSNEGLTSIARTTDIHELRYDSMETHTTLRANKNGVSNANFLAALIPFETDTPDVSLLCGLGCDAIRVNRGGFVDVAFLRTSVPASETGLAQDLHGNGKMTFYSETSTGQFSQFLIENGSLLRFGADTLAYATVNANYALGRMDATKHEAYASASGTYYIYHLGYVPGSVLGFGTVQSWQYDAGLDRLMVVIGDPGRFTIHEDVIIGSNPVQADRNLLIWPNPSAGNLHVETVLEQGQFELLGMDGRLLMSRRFNGYSFLLEVENLPAGVYLARVCDESGKVTGMQKVVLED